MDIDKLVPIPIFPDLNKLSDVVQNDFVKKTDYNKLVTKVDNIDTSGLVKKTDYNTKITGIEGKISDTNSGLVKKTDYNTKITEIKDKIPNASNLATKTTLNTVENKITDISNLATKTALTTLENKIPDTSNLVKKSDFNTNITNIENNVRQLQAYDSSYFKGKQYFDEGTGKQSYLVFLPLSKYFKLNSVAGVSDYVLSW